MAGGGIQTSPGSNKAYPGNLTLYVTFTCIVAGMGGLIFGYDIGISGNYIYNSLNTVVAESEKGQECSTLTHP
ncbi:hypothetical protein HanPI659440_Chr16g0644181 [Helianthus annuus]|nr:hypothetical protein HanPI659440_Chr16g0644181 [Helianthus annuus]